MGAGAVAAPLTQPPTIDMPAKQVATLKQQLKVANARLLAIEREREQLKADVAALLKRIADSV